jgi:hypothetical protein
MRILIISITGIPGEVYSQRKTLISISQLQGGKSLGLPKRISANVLSLWTTHVIKIHVLDESFYFLLFFIKTNELNKVKPTFRNTASVKKAADCSPRQPQLSFR